MVLFYGFDGICPRDAATGPRGPTSCERPSGSALNIFGLSCNEHTDFGEHLDSEDAGRSCRAGALPYQPGVAFGNVNVVIISLNVCRNDGAFAVGFEHLF